MNQLSEDGSVTSNGVRNNLFWHLSVLFAFLIRLHQPIWARCQSLATSPAVFATATYHGEAVCRMNFERDRPGTHLLSRDDCYLE